MNIWREISGWKELSLLLLLGRAVLQERLEFHAAAAVLAVESLRRLGGTVGVEHT